MGAEQFWTKAYGKTARAAFNSAVEEARYENGHGGYTGTIAEKEAFVMIPFDPGSLEITPQEYADLLMEKGDKRVDDKWGPAGCLEIPSDKEENCYLFFGIASS
jgi:hypothetical protein